MRADRAHPPEETDRGLSRLAQRLIPFAGRDAHAAAERLIAVFGTPGRALTASHAALKDTLANFGDLADTIAAARELADFGVLDQWRGERVDVADAEFLGFLRRYFACSGNEALLGVYLDADDRFLAAEQLATGSPSRVETTCRHLIARLLELGAHGVIIAHNHPSGDPHPSDCDVEATRGLARLLEAVGCMLRDHLIVGSTACFSMARAGSL